MGQSMSKQLVQSGVHRRAARAGALVTYPDSLLERPSYEVDPRDPEVVEVSAALIGTLRAMRSWGISAPQLGHFGRIVCVDAAGHPETRSCSGLVVLANPTLLAVSGTRVGHEICPSYPGFIVEVARAEHVVVSGTVPGSARNVIIEADAFEARCLLHELDHLDGIGVIDRAVPHARASSR